MRIPYNIIITYYLLANVAMVFIRSEVAIFTVKKGDDSEQLLGQISYFRHIYIYPNIYT